MTKTVPPLRTQVPLYPLLYFFNTVLNLILSLVYFMIVIFYCHFELRKRAICWMFIRVVIGFVHYTVLQFLITFFFKWKKQKRYSSSWTTFYTIIYITIVSFEFAWMLIGSLFYSKYVPEVQIKYFPLIALIYIICSWMELLFLPSIFLALLIVQFRRYRRYHRFLYEQSTQQDSTNGILSFATGGCCACCVEDDEDRCCCCYCACCEPKGIMASYILGDDINIEYDAREYDYREDHERKKKGCCGSKKEYRPENDSLVQVPSSEELNGPSILIPPLPIVAPNAPITRNNISSLPVVQQPIVQPSLPAGIPVTITERESTEGVTEGVVQGTPRGTPRVTSQGTPQGTPRGTSQGTSQGTPQVTPVEGSIHELSGTEITRTSHSAETPTNETNTHSEAIQQQPHSEDEDNVPIIYLPPTVQLPEVDVPVLHNLRVVPAVAEDGSGKIIYVALPLSVY